MLNLFKKIINGQWVQDIINNFDPYHIHELTRIEVTKEQNKKENDNGTLG
jgi:hypothetical protein